MEEPRALQKGDATPPSTHPPRLPPSIKLHFFFVSSQHQSAQTHFHAFHHTRLSFFLWVPLGVEISSAWGLVHLLSHMGRVRELEKGHVGFWTQKYCIKRSLEKSTLEQKCNSKESERDWVKKSILINRPLSDKQIIYHSFFISSTLTLFLYYVG